MFLHTFHRWDALIFIVYVFPNWMVVRILSHWIGHLLPLSLLDQLRDNEGAVIENYPSSLIGEIQFDLQDKLLLGIILHPLLVRFSSIYRTWTF